MRNADSALNKHIMHLRVALIIFIVCGVQPCAAETLLPAAVRDFVIGKLFDFHCFEGTRGSGRIFTDGSVAGTIQLKGTGQPRNATLPAGTLQVKGGFYCASLAGIPFEPCFEVDRVNSEKFRGSLLGSRWAFCEFTKGIESPVVAYRARLSRSSKPLQLAPSLIARSPNINRN